MKRRRQRADATQQFTSFDRIGSLACGEREGYGRSSIRGNHMNLGGPSAARFSDGLGAVFFNAPVPSGGTFTMVESILTASILMRPICSRCKSSKTIQHAALGPTIHAGVDGMPGTETLR